MTLERITKKSIDYAIQIQEELFPGESGRANFVESMDERSGYEYFLLYEGDICVGVIGIYSYPEDQTKAPGLGGLVSGGFRRKKDSRYITAIKKHSKRWRGLRILLVCPFVYGCCE